jgi:hypothetical protein
MRWIDNKELFVKELSEGFKWQTLPLTFLQLHNIEVDMPELKIRGEKKEIPEYFDSKDIIANNKRIEIKSRKERFTGPETFPYDTIIVDTVKKFDGREDKPMAYIMISRPTGCMMWIDTSKKDEWTIERKFDRTRKYWDNFYVISKSKLLSMDSLIEVLNVKVTT